MKKWGIIAGVGVVLVAVIWIMFGGNKTTNEASQSSWEYESDDFEYESDDKEATIVQENEQLDGLKLYKGQEEIHFDQLDEVESYAISFLIEYYKVSKEETEEALWSRIEHYFNGIEDLFSLSIKNGYLQPYFVRSLASIYLFPEYHETPTLYILPVLVTYENEGELHEHVMHFGVSKYTTTTDEENWSIHGHVDGYEWFERDITRKYNLDGQQ